MIRPEPLALSVVGPAPAAAALDAEQAWAAACVARVRRGDREAFGELYRRYARLVHGVLLARLPATEVPDQVQEVFLLALRHLPRLTDAAAFAPWLVTIARRAAADAYRRGGRSRPGTTEAAPEPQVAPALTADGLAVFQALGRLPAAYRETLILRLVGGMSGPEIAAATGLTAGSVRVNLTRGMKRLRQQLEGGPR
jgi:RNA polymerase sigma-70 factor, ECF subfamily